MSVMSIAVINEEGYFIQFEDADSETFVETRDKKFKWSGDFLKPKWDFGRNLWIDLENPESLVIPKNYYQDREKELGQSISELEIKQLEADYEKGHALSGAKNEYDKWLKRFLNDFVTSEQLERLVKSEVITDEQRLTIIKIKVFQNKIAESRFK